MIELQAGQLLTGAGEAEPAVADGRIVADPGRDLAKLAVVERHHATGRVGVGLVRGFGLRRGAFASTVAHDAHNVVVAGADDASMLACVARLAALGGGIAVADAGAGPYLAVEAFAEFDSELVDLMSGSADQYLPAATLGIGGGETDQLALAITGGYRARFPMFVQDGAAAGRNGMYVAANFHYLHGLRFDEFEANLQMETDAAGLVSPTPQAPPFTLEWQTATTGRGLASDFGVAFVRNRWDFGVGVSGVANRIVWSKITRHELTLVSLFDGNEWVHVRLPRIGAKSRFELPVTYTADVAYHREKWSVLTEASYGFEGKQFPYRPGVQV